MSVLKLLHAKAHLNITSSGLDAELQAFIDAAEAALSNRVGPLLAVQVTRQVRGGGTALVLPVTPAISLVSVTPLASAAMLLTDLFLDVNTGLVTHASYNGIFPAARYAVVYQAGWQTGADPEADGYVALPGDLMLADKELVRHLWLTQRGSGVQRPGSKSPDTLSNTLPGSAFTLPFRVEQLLAPYIRTGFY